METCGWTSNMATNFLVKQCDEGFDQGTEEHKTASLRSVIHCTLLIAHQALSSKQQAVRKAAARQSAAVADHRQHIDELQQRHAEEQQVVWGSSIGWI